MSRPKTVRRYVGIGGARMGAAFLVVLSVVLSTAQPLSAAEIQIFTATLTGAQEVPAVSTAGTGTGTVMLNAAENQITVNLRFSGLSSNATMSHIHGAAAAGSNAGILFDFQPVTPAAMSGTIPQQTFSITPAQVADLKAGLFYFNVHTGNHGGGEIRGQIGLAATQFNTTLTGAQQVPAVSSPGTGTGTVALNAAEDLLFVDMSFSGLSSNANVAHIHGPAASGGERRSSFRFRRRHAGRRLGQHSAADLPDHACGGGGLEGGPALLQYPHGELRRRRDPRPDRLPGHHHAAGEPGRRGRQNAMFTVAAKGAPAALTYLWQESVRRVFLSTISPTGAPTAASRPRR